MKDSIALSTQLGVKVVREADFFDNDHKEYRIVFYIYDHQGNARNYTVIINRRHLTSASYDIGDSKKAAMAFAVAVVKKRFTLASPPENAAICRGKICEFTTISE